MAPKKTNNSEGKRIYDYFPQKKIKRSKRSTMNNIKASIKKKSGYHGKSYLLKE